MPPGEAVGKLGGIFSFALSTVEAKWETASVSLRFPVPVPTCLCGWEGLIFVMWVAQHPPDRNPLLLLFLTNCLPQYRPRAFSTLNLLIGISHLICPEADSARGEGK